MVAARARHRRAVVEHALHKGQGVDDNLLIHADLVVRGEPVAAVLIHQRIDAPAVLGLPGAHGLAGLLKHDLAGFMIIVPGFDVVVVNAGLFQDLGVVPHNAGADVVVDAVELAVLGIVVEAAHDQVVFHRLDNVIQVGQLDVTLQIVCEHVDLDVHDIGSTFARLQGNRELVVHILIGIHLHVDVQLGVVRVGVPLVQHLFVKLRVELLEGPQGQVDRLLTVCEGRDSE